MSQRSSASLPSALDRLPEFRRRLEGKRAAVFLDYDGTLTPIVAKPELAVLSEAMRDAVDRLSRLCVVAVISGRARRVVEGFMGLDRVIYAGSHGLDIAGPGSPGLRKDVGGEFREIIDGFFAKLSQEVSGIAGALVEHTVYGATAHYRQVAPDRVAWVEEAVDRVLAGYPTLRKTRGKMILDIRPRVEWDKGKAALWILESLGLAPSNALALYIGDDLTDEDAFREMKGRGAGILVTGATPRTTMATHSLRDVEEARRFLEAFISLLEAGPQA